MVGRGQNRSQDLTGSEGETQLFHKGKEEQQVSGSGSGSERVSVEEERTGRTSVGHAAQGSSAFNEVEGLRENFRVGPTLKKMSHLKEECYVRTDQFWLI